MENKKGFLLGEETLKIIVAVIVIIFLIYLLVSLYFAKVHGDELKQAKESVRRISEVVQGNGTRVDAVNPQGWYIFSFTGARKPNSCAGKNCLCICEKLVSWNFWGSQDKECSDNGVCLIIPDLRSFDRIKIESVEDSITNLMIKIEKGDVVIQKVK